MALSASDFSDFIEPAGELDEEMFPGLDLEAYVKGWIQDAQDKTSGLDLSSADEEAAQIAWVYHRAFNKLANRLNTNPAQYDVEDEGSEQWLVSQMQYARDKADAYEDEFDDLTEEEETATAPRSTTTQSKTSWV